jgi:hypothetical protein
MAPAVRCPRVTLKQTMLEAYERRTREVIELFLNHGISFEECTAALDAAFGAIITKVTGKELLAVIVLAMENNETVMKEMKRRESPPGAPIV